MRLLLYTSLTFSLLSSEISSECIHACKYKYICVWTSLQRYYPSSNKKIVVRQHLHLYLITICRHTCIYVFVCRSALSELGIFENAIHILWGYALYKRLFLLIKAGKRKKRNKEKANNFHYYPLITFSMCDFGGKLLRLGIVKRENEQIRITHET